MRSESCGHKNKPNIIPRGYADVSDPKDAPMVRPKCSPRAGVMGPATTPCGRRQIARRGGAMSQFQMQGASQKLQT